MIRILRTTENTRRCGPLNHRGQPDSGADPDPVALAVGSLEFFWSRNTSDLDMVKMYTVTLIMGTNDVSRGKSRKVMRLHEKMSCILEELRIYLDPVILTICTVPYNMKTDQHAMEMNEMVRTINEICRLIQQRSVLPVRLLDVADMMERSFPDDASSDSIHFDWSKGSEWLNGVFQRHITGLESDLLETAQFTLGPPLYPLSLPLDPYPVAWERDLTQETAQGAAGPANRGPHRWIPKRQSGGGGG